MLLLKKWQGFPIAAAIGTHKQSCLLHVLDQASKTTMLIDSGAEVSVRPATNSRKQQHPEGPPLRAANGGNIRTFGTSIATVDIGFNTPFTCKFYHAEVTQAILGADFLRQSGLFFFCFVFNLFCQNCQFVLCFSSCSVFERLNPNLVRALLVNTRDYLI